MSRLLWENALTIKEVLFISDFFFKFFCREQITHTTFVYLDGSFTQGSVWDYFSNYNIFFFLGGGGKLKQTLTLVLTQLSLNQITKHVFMGLSCLQLWAYNKVVKFYCSHSMSLQAKVRRTFAKVSTQIQQKEKNPNCCQV